MSGILALASGTPLPNESESDHATDDATSEITDKTIGNSKVTSMLTLPVTNGTIGITQTTESTGNDLEVLDSIDDTTDDTTETPVAPATPTSFAAPAPNSPTATETETRTNEISDVGSLTTNLGGFTTMNLTDPTTGVKTSILTGGTSDDTSGYDLSDMLKQTLSSGSAARPSSYNEKATSDTTDKYNSTSLLNISIKGDAAPDVAVDFSTNLKAIDKGGSGDQGQECGQRLAGAGHRTAGQRQWCFSPVDWRAIG